MRASLFFIVAGIAAMLLLFYLVTNGLLQSQNAITGAVIFMAVVVALIALNIKNRTEK